eukprot:54095_1
MTSLLLYLLEKLSVMQVSGFTVCNRIVISIIIWIFKGSLESSTLANNFAFFKLNDAATTLPLCGMLILVDVNCEGFKYFRDIPQTVNYQICPCKNINIKFANPAVIYL